tara:strand:+ start:571 stop:1038 length:468 start_codon:yes stop_codon:yes gene_type:complete
MPRFLTTATIITIAHGFAPESATTKPHLIFFMADDLGWNNVGWHNSDMLTPHADALVKQGVELDRHYAFQYCSPSRSSLMTGRLPYHVQQINRQNCNLARASTATSRSSRRSSRRRGTCATTWASGTSACPTGASSPRGADSTRRSSVSRAPRTT